MTTDGFFSSKGVVMESKHDTLSDGKKEFDPMALGPLWIILAAVCVIGGCPRVGRRTYIEQQTSGFNFYHIDGFGASATNDTFFIDAGGEPK